MDVVGVISAGGVAGEGDVKYREEIMDLARKIGSSL